MKFYIAQGIGFISMILAFISFQQNEKKKFLFIQAACGAAFALHFFLLSAFTGVAMNFIAIPRGLIFAQEYEKKKQLFFTILFIGLFMVFGIITWEGPMSIFPIMGMSLSTVVFSLKKPGHIRLLSLPISLFWVIYNIVSLSVAGVITESFVILSILIAIFRFGVLNKNLNKK